MDYAQHVNKKKKMLKVNLTNCSTCISVNELLCEIDTHIKKYTDNKYKNITLLTSLPYDKEVLGSLLHYKRILTNRLFNPEYGQLPLAVITSRIKILINK